MRKKVIGKPCEGELHARIDEELLVKSEEETSDLLYSDSESATWCEPQ